MPPNAEIYRAVAPKTLWQLWPTVALLIPLLTAACGASNSPRSSPDMSHAAVESRENACRWGGIGNGATPT